MFREQLVEAWTPVDVFGRTTRSLHCCPLGSERVGNLGHTGREDLSHPVADEPCERRAGAVSTDRCCHSTRSGDGREDELAVDGLISSVSPDTPSACRVGDRCIRLEVTGGSHDEPLMLQMTVVEGGGDHLAASGNDPVDIDMLTDVSTDQADDCTSVEEPFGLTPSDAATPNDEHGDLVKVQEHRIRKPAAMGLHAVILGSTFG